MRASQMWLGLVCLMGLAGCCLSLDYYDHQATIEVQKMKEEREEFKRFWEEVVKSNPSLQKNQDDLHLEELIARNSDEVPSRMAVEDIRNMQKLQMLRESKHDGMDGTEGGHEGEPSSSFR